MERKEFKVKTQFNESPEKMYRAAKTAKRLYYTAKTDNHDLYDDTFVYSIESCEIYAVAFNGNELIYITELDESCDNCVKPKEYFLTYEEALEDFENNKEIKYIQKGSAGKLLGYNKRQEAIEKEYKESEEQWSL